ncbi:MAG TPA: excinuclease ABC subunit UvrC [Kiritimatiellia bacterium]|nr:excinuclease ABC subunit UvrC [Kiritimatiellia bacterium]
MSISQKVKSRLASLPDKPGVYFMRDKDGKIIYVGKAASLRSRVRSYFRSSSTRGASPKLRSLINSIDDFDFIVVKSDADAVVTEGRLIKEYRPHYNALLKDDKRFLLLRVHLEDPYPRIQPCRIKKPDGALYLGPYARSDAARTALEYAERYFGLRSCSPRLPDEQNYRHCHNDVIRFCSAPCMKRISRDDYLIRVHDAIAFLRGERRDLLDDIKSQMDKAAAEQKYEKAAELRDTLAALWSAIRERSRGIRDLELKEEDALAGIRELHQLLDLPRPATVIECFDNSNLQGSLPVSAMVCAINGIPQRQRYRHFRIKSISGIDDPAMMAEAVGRRYQRLKQEGATMPDLILIDGGVTQLKAARDVLTSLGLNLPTAGLAKRFEEIYTDTDYQSAPIRLPSDSNALKVLQRIRDEAHRFSLTYHRSLRAKKIRESALDEVEGIGDKRKELLIKEFGSVLRIARASEEEISKISGIGPVMAKAIKEHLSRNSKSVD